MSLRNKPTDRQKLKLFLKYAKDYSENKTSIKAYGRHWFFNLKGELSKIQEGGLDIS